MSSEDKSLEPSDQGQSPPLSSAEATPIGATPSGSPAPSDRRPRGRPRKDAGSAIHGPRPKRKSRSRGRAQADDEDSMDGSEPADTEPLQDMEMAELDLEEEEPLRPLLYCPGDLQPLSPLFQRSVSEDSAGSSASASDNAKTSERLCAFCYCGERSVLGQGDLKLFGPTPGYVPLHIRNRHGSSEKDDDYHDDDNDSDDNDHSQSPGQRESGLKKISSPDSGLHSSSAPGSSDPFGEEPTRRPWDELGQIGLPDDINVQSLFDPTGQCCAHLRCAAWSDGVCRTEGQVLLYVDKAIDSGSTEFCAYCKRLGASIKCCEGGCCRSYHFPCAAAAGTFQDCKRYTLLCPDHLEQALHRSKDEVTCLVCDSSGDLHDQLFCSTCGQHYHGACLEVAATPLKRAGWQCPDCKVCLACRNPGDDNKMLVCDMCDKGYHTYCLQPVMDAIPTGGWRCQNCRVCAQCGTRANGQWSSAGPLCDDCQRQPDPAHPCPLCGRSLAAEAPKDLLTCHTCKGWVHLECERQGKEADWDPRSHGGFLCSVCRQGEAEGSQTQGSTPRHPLSPLPSDPNASDVFMAVEEDEEKVELETEEQEEQEATKTEQEEAEEVQEEQKAEPQLPVEETEEEEKEVVVEEEKQEKEKQEEEMQEKRDEEKQEEEAKEKEKMEEGKEEKEMEQEKEVANITEQPKAEEKLTTEDSQQGIDESTITEESTGTEECTAIEESTAVTEESTAVTEESAAVTEESAAVTEESAAVTEESAAVTEESAAVTEESAAVTEESAAVTEESAAGTEESAAGTEESAAITEESAAITEESAAGTEESTGTEKSAVTEEQVEQEEKAEEQLAVKEWEGVEEEEEKEEVQDVTLEQEASASPTPDDLQEEKKESPSAEPAQEIQVTVTLTEGAESPQHSSSLGVSSLSQDPTSPENSPQDREVPDAMETEKEVAELVPEIAAEREDEVEGEPQSTESPVKEPLPSPSKEVSSPEPVVAAEDESMEVCPSEPSVTNGDPIREIVPEPSPEVQNVVSDQPEEKMAEDNQVEEVEEAKDEDEVVAAAVAVEEEEREMEEDKQELLSVLPDLDSVPFQDADTGCMADADVDGDVDMDTTPVSEHGFSGFGSPPGDDKSLKFSPGFSSEGSSRLARSPFSTEASPREGSLTPAHCTPTLPPPTTTFIPLTPKIGMGKPAISKRKFSPGRPRVKQGAWSNRSAGRSPSWSPEYGECGDGPRTRLLQGTPVWTVRVGRGSGFPGRRRPRGANLSGRGGRGRSRLKADSIPPIIPGVSAVEQPFVLKEEEENSMHNTVVMFSSSDSFTLKQDMCVVCGSFGQGEEGRLLACSQCGQCYHPYCVNIKITKVVLSKGWRCLECTVCEACGQATDPGRLLLCDDCDISYHTYCLDPPLQNVPKGSWKCKWCVSCTQCGATTAGVRCEWQCNYTQCGPCASLAVCPVCVRSYREDDLILQCRLCDRWVHASCQGLNTDEEVESAADDGFDCSMCRLHTSGQGGVTVTLSDRSESPIVAQIITKVKEPEYQKTYTQDGVCLTESGLSQLQALSAPAPRRRRPKPKLKLKIINQNSVAVLQTPPDPMSELSRDGDLDDSREGDLLLDCEGKSDSSPEREPAEVDVKGEEGTDGNKKRKRKPYRPGIGGFMVRQRSRTGQGKGKRSLSRKDSSGSLNDNPVGKEEGWNEPDTPVDETAPPTEVLEKKKKYRRKKTQLEEAFPSYLQEAFFGKELLDKSKQSRQALEPGLLIHDHGAILAETKPPSATSRFLDPSCDPLLSATATGSSSTTATPGSTKTRTLPQAGEDPLADLVLGSDDDLLGMLSDNLGKPGQDTGLDFCPFQVDRSASPFAGLDIGGLSEHPSVTAHPSGPARGSRPLQEEPLDAILSPELDKMVTDGAILSKLYKIPELEGKDVEDLFTAVLSPSTSQPPPLPHPPTANPIPSAPGTGMPLQNSDSGMFPRMPMMNGMMGPNPVFPQTPMLPGAPGPCGQGGFSPLHRMPFPDIREKNFGQMGGDMAGPWPPAVPGSVPGPMAPPEPEADTMSNAQRSTLKWEKEETLGEMATVAPVLYTNINFPNLREEFPDWATRVKQIAKLWRKASSQERQPYVQKARDNRAALRINKVQLSNDTLKRQQQQVPDPFDPSVPLETEAIFKDPLKHKESEHEQEWKFRQGEINHMRGPLKKQQEKVPKSKAIKSTNKDVLFGHSNQATIAAGSGKISLQMRQKSKQQAKIEATQKLEQVKNEQQQLQQQQQQQQQQQNFPSSGQSGGDTPTSGNQSPRTPQPSGGGNASPLQPKDGGFARPQLPGTPTSASDDVFLRPQLPPPSASSASKTPTQEGAYPQGPASQPQSPQQMFSPGGSSTGSRPSSPWDPYGKMVGTPRPPTSGSTTPRRGSDAQERGRPCPSPAHEGFGSPTSAPDPYAKPPDTPRPADPFVKPMGPPRMGMSGMGGDPQQQQPQQGQGRHMMGPMASGDSFGRPNQRAEAYQRMAHSRMVLSDPYARPLLAPIPGSNESGSVPLFKAPMPPGQHQQEAFGSMPPQGLRRGPIDPYERPPLTPRPADGFQQGQQPDPYAHQPLTPHPSMGADGFGNEPRMMRQQQGGHFPMPRHPHSNPYAQAPSTPRPDYSQQMPDPYAQPPGTPRPSPDPYAQPPGTPRPVDPYAQPPGTPRPSADMYAMPPSTPRPPPLDQFSQPQPMSRRQSPSHAMDPYAQMPGTPRPLPGERYPKSPGAQRSADPYAQPPGTPRPQSKPDLYDQPPGTPRPVLSSPDAFSRPGSRPGSMPHPGEPFSHQAQGRMQDAFGRPHGSQTPKHSGMSDDGFSLPQTPHSSQTPVHDPCEQAPMTPCPQAGDRPVQGVPQSPGAADVMQPPMGDSEDKTKRQLLRQLILRQQQRKVQQELPTNAAVSAMASAPGTPRHWSQEDSSAQPDFFGRPPPPYPGTMRGPPRFPGQFVGEQRGPFPHDGQMPRPPFSREMVAMGMRPQGQRFGFPQGAPGQEQLMRPPHQMPGGHMAPENMPPQMRRSLSIDLARPMGGNAQMGLPQHFPPRALPMQQHNIMGQPFIELRHRAPENRMRLPFRPLGPMDHPNQPGQRPPQGFMPGQEMGFVGPQGQRMMDPMLGQPQQGAPGPMQMGADMEAMQQQQQQQQHQHHHHQHQQQQQQHHHHQQANMQMNAGQQHPTLSRSMSQPIQSETLHNTPQPALLPGATQPEELPLPTAEGIEEKLDADDSAVKDLEDVEVKDLVDDDLETLNLDGEDGLHLDDFLTSGKFDLIAYADPELDLEDKKDMFNEELDLADPMEDDHGEALDIQKALSEKRNTHQDTAAATASLSPPAGKADNLQMSDQVKKEDCASREGMLYGGKTIKTEVKPCPVSSHDPSSMPPMNTSGISGDHTGLFGASAQPSSDPLSGSAPVLSSLLIKEKLEDSGLGAAAASPHQTTHGQGLQQVMSMMPGQALDHGMNPAMGLGHRMDPSLAQGAPPLTNPNMMQPANPKLPVPGFGGPSTGQQVDLNMPMMGGQLPAGPHGLARQTQQGMFPLAGMGQQQQQKAPPPGSAPVSQLSQSQLQNRPLLLEEQPLLLQDLLDQERQEQQQQRQMQAMIRQRSDTFFPNVDFDAITDPIMKAKMVALQGINKVMAQNPLAMGPMVMNRIQQIPGAHVPEAAAAAAGAPHLFGQDGKLATQLARPNPPNFGPGFVNDTQRKQYEEWLQDTQQLLQMQQKFLEEQIGSHRKSKKALSAKQRTAKKAGREFPEEDAEQLKHVTEQQSMVQKQLEQIRKQQKEHAELIEEYRVKQQQHNLQHPMMPPMPVMPPQTPGMMPGQGPGPGPMNQPMMGPMMGMQPHPGQPNPPQRMPIMPNMPNMPGWHPGPGGPMGVGGGPRLPALMPPQMPPANPAQQVPPQQPPAPPMVPGAAKPTPIAAAGMAASGGSAGAGGAAAAAAGGPSPHVKFDDNNPFSEGFQERERRERLREQQERQRVQLMQEVERQRALQKQMDMGMGSADASSAAPVSTPAPGPRDASLAQMPFYNSELPQDFLQPTRPTQQQQQMQQQQMGAMFPQPQQAGMDFIGAPGQGFMQGNQQRPGTGNGGFSPDMGPNFRGKSPMMAGHGFPQGQPQRPTGFAGPPGSGHPQQAPGGDGSAFGMDSPSTPLPPNYPGSGQSLIQLYSNIIPEEKSKKKRSRKKKSAKDDDADSVRTPSTPHSDITAPLTPRTPSTPTRASSALAGEPDLSTDTFAGLAPASELERQLSSVGGGHGGPSLLSRQCSGGSMEAADRQHPGQLHEVKLEKIEASECHGPPDLHRMVKQEAGQELTLPNLGGSDASGNELLKHLLKNKSTPPPSQGPPHQTSPLQHQTSVDSLRSEDDMPNDSKSMLKMGAQTVKPELLEASGPEQGKRKQQRYKRGPKTGMEKPPSRYKKRKKEEEERQIAYSNTDSLMSQLKQQLTMLPLMEPLIGVNFALFPPYGSSGQLNGENRLSGSFGSATLDGVSDYYSQLVYKQSNLSNPPTPPASLPPTPPPVARQKMVNGFATAEELARKAAVMVPKSLGPKPLPTPYHPEDDLLAQTISQGPKTVDVPASLPTPPHNNQEELRWAPQTYRGLGARTGQEHCSDRDTPDSFVPSSSPESVVGMEISRYPDLSRVKLEPPSPATSPLLPMLPPASGKGSEIRKWEVKSEPTGPFFGSSFGLPSSCSKSDLVSIAITLNSAAANNVPGVVAAVANLLRVPIPNTYDENRIPERSSLALLAGVKVPPSQGALFSQQHLHRSPAPPGPPGMIQGPPLALGRLPSTGSTGRHDYQMGNSSASPGPKAQWCCHCKVVVLGNGVRKSTKDLPCAKLEGQVKLEGTLVFCSHSCFLLYSAALQVKISNSKPSVAMPSDASSVMGSPSKVLHAYSNNMSSLDVHCLAQLQPKQSPPSSPPIHFPTLSPADGSTSGTAADRLEPKSDPAFKFTVKLKPRPRAVHLEDGSLVAGVGPRGHTPAKRWKGHRWRKWSVQILVARSGGVPPLPGKGRRPEDEKRLPVEGPGASWLRPEPMPRDHRRCCLCQRRGDGETDGPARLLNLDLDVWVHLNCALWSSEVYETQAGALINVELALRRGLALRCAHCQQTGATSGCHRLRCANAYHFTCALEAHCVFFKDKTMLCHVHRPRGAERGGGSGGGMGGGAGGGAMVPGMDQELHCFAVFRRVYVQRDEVRQLASIVRRGERNSTFRVGSLVFHAVGQLLPGQMQAFHAPGAIYPVGYEASRFYWSMRQAHRRCRYVCAVDERDGLPEFSIRVVEQGYEDLVLTDTTPKGVWDQVLGPMAECRNETGMLKLFPVYLKGEDLFGLTVSSVTRIIESLPGVEACERYTFRYGRNPLMELPLAINPSGCARSEPKACTHVKRFVLRPHTLTSGSAAKTLQSGSDPVQMGAPYSKQFVHSKSSQYRRMKAEWKSNVYLARSRIQGLGLYAARDLEKYTMVIEYIGTLIRNEVANRKEKMYEDQNRGVYMFRIDSEHVIDATITGGPARYINHSCAPNCIAEVVTLERGHKIIISSNRRIQRGEELCYDYKFDLEDDQHKIPCHCGAVNCRKWMN
ncbi:histone-lysine N-methyltransferase 2C [Alosa pseudoharengus]|uniref:histone-lysine N-methyltransferase 2C n=1 Tax=Alosa pseudoharengus TaxID=34774 RepID=UPI003F8BC8FA